MSNATIRGIWVEGELVNSDISVNFPIISATLASPAAGLLGINDLLDVDAPTPANGNILQYNSTSGQWEPQALSGGGDMLAATYDPGGIASNVYARANHTGTQLAATISDFDIEVSNNTDVDANTTHAGLTTGNPHSVTATDVGAMADLVDDTSPQLGGNLDTNGNQIQLGYTEDGDLINIGPNKLFLNASSASGNSAISSVANELTITGGSGLVLKGSVIKFEESGGDEFTLPDTHGSSGHVVSGNGSGVLSMTDPNTLISAASTTTAGKVELATITETDTGTDTGRAVTPDALAGSYAGTAGVGITCFERATDVTTGDGAGDIPIPSYVDGMNLVRVMAHVIAAGTTGTTDIQIRNVTQAADMLSTKLTIDSGETSSETAATAAVIDTANDDVATGDILRIDVDAISTTAPQGLIVTLEFRLP